MTSLLLDNDLSYVSKKIRLSISKTAVLTEENTDLSLILDFISESPTFKKSDKYKLNFPTYCKLLIHKYTHGQNISLNDKNIVSEALNLHFYTLKKKSACRMPVPIKIKDLENAGFYLILVGIFENKFKITIGQSKLISLISNYFWVENTSISKNIENWIKILNNIKNDGWL